MSPRRIPLRATTLPEPGSEKRLNSTESPDYWQGAPAKKCAATGKNPWCVDVEALPPVRPLDGTSLALSAALSAAVHLVQSRRQRWAASGSCPSATSG